MPKLHNVTDAEFQALVEAAAELAQTCADYSRRMEQSYHDPITKMASAVRMLNSLVHSVSELNAVLLAKITLAEQKIELEAMLRARAAKPQEPA